MPTQIHPLICYLASGSLHLAAIGTVMVGLDELGLTKPAQSVRWGDTDATISSAWAPETQAPRDEGPLVSVLGSEHGELTREVELLAPVAVTVLRDNEHRNIDVTTPTASPPRQREVDPQQLLDERLTSLASPERLIEPVFEPVQPPVVEPHKAPQSKPRVVEADAPPPTPESVERAVAALDIPKNARSVEPPKVVVQPTPKAPSQPAPPEPPLPNDLPERPAVKPIAQPLAVQPQPAKPPVEPAPTTKTPTALAAVTKPTTEPSAQAKGISEGTASRGQNSSASAEIAASELPPGGKPDSLPQKPGNAVPPYPPEAYRQGQEGVVLLDVTIAATGSVTRLKLYRSSGFRLLDEAAELAVTDWKFEPARYRGRAIAYRVVVPVRFSLTQ